MPKPLIVNVSEARGRLAELLRRVKEDHQEVLITNRVEPIALLVGHSTADGQRLATLISPEAAGQRLSSWLERTPREDQNLYVSVIGPTGQVQLHSDLIALLGISPGQRMTCLLTVQPGGILITPDPGLSIVDSLSVGTSSKDAADARKEAG